MYLLRNDGILVEVGWLPDFRSYLARVQINGFELLHHEFESPQECLDAAARYMEERPSSMWIWRMFNDSIQPSAPIVRRHRQHEAPGGISHYSL